MKREREKVTIIADIGAIILPRVTHVPEIERIAQKPVGFGGPIGRVGEVVAQLGNLKED